jgi:hypothetical protein
MMAYCTACGRPRVPLTATSVNLAGQPSQVTGAIARIFGWIVLFGGLTAALVLFALLQAIFPAGFVGFAFGVPVALASIVTGWALLRGGRTLEREGKGTERRTKTRAIMALAQNRGGRLSARDVAGALSISLEQADALLTDLAKSRPDHVSVEVDESSGTLIYRIDPEGAVRLRVFDDEIRIGEPREEVSLGAIESSERHTSA